MCFILFLERTVQSMSSNARRTQQCVTGKKNLMSWGVLEAESWNRSLTLSLFLLLSVRFYGYNIACWMFGVSAISGSVLFMFKIRREFLLQWSIRHIESGKVHSTQRFLFGVNSMYILILDRYLRKTSWNLPTKSRVKCLTAFWYEKVRGRNENYNTVTLTSSTHLQWLFCVL